MRPLQYSRLRSFKNRSFLWLLLMVRSQWNEAGNHPAGPQCFLGAPLVLRLLLPDRKGPLGPQDQQIPVESNWLWNNNSPLRKQKKKLHFWTIDSWASRWPRLFTWTCFLRWSMHLPILLSLSRSSRIYLPLTCPSMRVGPRAGFASRALLPEAAVTAGCRPAIPQH